MSNPLPLGEVVRAALADAGISENAASVQSAIPRETLRRRIITGDFRYGELQKVAVVLGTTAAELLARAEERAA